MYQPSNNKIPQAPIDEQAYRLQRYRDGQTVAEVDDEIARLKAFDQRDAQLQAAEDKRVADRIAQRDAMMAEQNAQAAIDIKRLEESANYWAPPGGVDPSPFMVKPTPGKAPASSEPLPTRSPYDSGAPFDGSKPRK